MYKKKKEENHMTQILPLLTTSKRPVHLCITHIDNDVQPTSRTSSSRTETATVLKNKTSRLLPQSLATTMLPSVSVIWWPSVTIYGSLANFAVWLVWLRHLVPTALAADLPFVDLLTLRRVWTTFGLSILFIWSWSALPPLAIARAFHFQQVFGALP